MKETVEILENLKDVFAVKKSNCLHEGEDLMALAYGDARILLSEAISKIINNDTKKLA
jgi:hypothetical protein